MTQEKITLPISSVDCRPHLTRFGGSLGLCGLSAELSNTTVACTTVPFGSLTRSL